MIMKNIPIEAAIIERVRSVPYFEKSIYHDLDLIGTLDFFNRRYVNPLNSWVDISEATVLDCGAGFGWFSIAYLMSGGAKAILVDMDKDRLQAAKEISRIFAVDDRAQFLNASFNSLKVEQEKVDIFVSIETLEHVGQKYIRPSLDKIKRIAAQGILITTPNKLFPVIAHDTRLPCAHWLSPGIRQLYAELLGRGSMNANNAFVSPFDLNILMDKFAPVSKCLTFSGFNEYRSHFPFYLPYGKHRHRHRARPSALESVYYRVVSSVLGAYSYWLMPSLAHIFLRR
jgi:ubiquinone/menaquinone biosynthesis C-methylase UbiE